MATSPNYGWAEPDNSSLVKNGAQDIRALGDAIDTSLWNVGFGQAGKNKIINGDFGIWQRGTSFTTTDVYGSDRWLHSCNATFTVSRQTFTPGTAPVAGYESQYFYRFDKSSGGTYAEMSQKIEDVRTFAGQTITVSFWAKVSSGTLTVEPYYAQNFGSGGSGTVAGAIGTVTVTTSWQRFSLNLAVPSISGKTVGTSSFLQLYIGRAITSSAFILDIWGVQAEYGSKATPFETATGTIQGELAACQRYFYKTTNGNYFATGSATNTTEVVFAFQLPVYMRSLTSLSISNAADFLLIGASNKTFTAINSAMTTTASGTLVASFYTSGSSGLTAGQSFSIYSATGNLSFSAEL